MSKGFRTTLKGLVPEKTWPLLRWFDKQLIYCLYIWLWAKRVLVYPRIPVRAESVGSQSIATFPITVDYNTAQPEDFFFQLKSQGYTVFEGRHSIYLGNTSDIDRFCPNLLKRYPKDVGLKIIKSQEISKDLTPYYTSRKIAPASTWFSMRAVGSMLEKMTVSNLLHMEGIAPCVYDIVQLTTSKGVLHYAFVVEHIQGTVLTGLPASDFMKSFKAALAVNGMETISIKEHRDLRAPEYNHNIVSGKSAPCYVDIQNFVLSDKALVAEIINEQWDFLLPLVTYHNILECLKRENIPLRDKKVLLVGNYSAGFLPNVLTHGAEWCSAVMQDEYVQKKYEKALYLWGISRFDLLSFKRNCNPGMRDLSFSQYDMVCLDKKYLPWLEIMSSKLSAPTYLLYFGDEETDVNVVQHCIEKSMMRQLKQIKVLNKELGGVVVSLFKCLGEV